MYFYFYDVCNILLETFNTISPSLGVIFFYNIECIFTFYNKCDVECIFSLIIILSVFYSYMYYIIKIKIHSV